MISKEQIEQIENNILISKYDVVLFGSQVTNEIRPTSDIDIAIITKIKNREKNIRIQKEILGSLPLIYDIKVFELMPIDIQISIIDSFKVIIGDSLEITEYFYDFRKKWDDVKHRILGNQFKSMKESLELKERGKKILSLYNQL